MKLNREKKCFSSICLAYFIDEFSLPFLFYCFQSLTI